MTYQYILTKIDDDGVLIITINRADKLNALNSTVLKEIAAALKAHVDNADVNGVIITGAGKKAFAAGADISEFANFDAAEGRDLSVSGIPIFKGVETYPKPVIAAVNGYALGGGCELTMACHLRVASENARFGQPEVNLGLIPGYGGTQRLIQLIGKGKALELLMTADLIKAPEALQLGLVNYVVPFEELMPKCKAILAKIATKSPVAIDKVIQAVDGYYTDGVDGLANEAKLFGECFGTDDFKEGTTAFLNKRKAEFKRG